MEENDQTREATDVAETTPYLFERINEHLGIHQGHYFDMTEYVPYFEKENDYDAEIQELPADLGFNNFPWSKAQLHMKRMTVKFLDDDQSFIAICNDKMDEREYFKNFIEIFADQLSLPLTVFGGYIKKLDRGVKIVYLL